MNIIGTCLVVCLNVNAPNQRNCMHDEQSPISKYIQHKHFHLLYILVNNIPLCRCAHGDSYYSRQSSLQYLHRRIIFISICNQLWNWVSCWPKAFGWCDYSKLYSAFSTITSSWKKNSWGKNKGELKYICDWVHEDNREKWMKWYHATGHVPTGRQVLIISYTI